MILITDDIPLTPSPSRCTFFPGFMDYVPGASAQNPQPNRKVCLRSRTGEHISSFTKVTRLQKVPEHSSVQSSDQTNLPCSNPTENERNVVNIATQPDKKPDIEGSVWERQSDAKCNPQDKTETNISGDTIGQREARYGLG